MAYRSPDGFVPVWVWVLTVLVLALLVWAIGKRMEDRPHVEVGISGAPPSGLAAPAVATPGYPPLAAATPAAGPPAAGQVPGTGAAVPAR